MSTTMRPWLMMTLGVLALKAESRLATPVRVRRMELKRHVATEEFVGTVGPKLQAVMSRRRLAYGLKKFKPVYLHAAAELVVSSSTWASSRSLQKASG